MKINGFARHRTVAVIGSIAAIGGSATAIAATRPDATSHVAASGRAAGAPGRKPLASLSAGELAALAKARAAIAAQASAIATPILDRAVAAATITAADRSAFLAALAHSPGPGSGPDGTWTGATGATGPTGGPSGSRPSAAARAVFQSVQSAIQAHVSSIATPVLDSAVADATISSAQETTLLALLTSGPIGPGGGHGGPHGGPPPGGPDPAAA